jgi:hypothetical protein
MDKHGDGHHEARKAEIGDEGRKDSRHLSSDRLPEPRGPVLIRRKAAAPRRAWPARGEMIWISSRASRR